MSSKLTRGLMTLPDLVGNFGISIANAQKLMNASYLETIERFMTIFASSLCPDSQRLWGDGANPPPAAGTTPKPPVSIEAIKVLLEQVAPPRYQFTETHIHFRAELFEAQELLVKGGFAGGFGGAMISVAGAYGSRTEYRAAARVTSTIHAIPSSKETLGTLLGRVKEIGDVKPPEGDGATKGKVLDLDGLDMAMLGTVTNISELLGDDVSKQKDKLARIALERAAAMEEETGAEDDKKTNKKTNP